MFHFERSLCCSGINSWVACFYCLTWFSSVEFPPCFFLLPVFISCVSCFVLKVSFLLNVLLLVSCAALFLISVFPSSNDPHAIHLCHLSLLSHAWFISVINSFNLFLSACTACTWAQTLLRPAFSTPLQRTTAVAWSVWDFIFDYCLLFVIEIRVWFLSSLFIIIPT